MHSEPPSDDRFTLAPSPADAEFARPIPAWIASTILHVLILSAIALIQMPESRRRISQIIRMVPDTHVEESPLEEIDFRKLKVDDETRGDQRDVVLNLPSAPVVSAEPILDVVVDPQPVVTGFEAQQSLQFATGSDFNRRIKRKGLAGVGTDSTELAIDRLTREILLSLEERPTLVVWLLDQSASLIRQRQAIHARFDRIYQEIGAVRAGGGSVEAKPLISSIVAFGNDVSLGMKNPTDDVEKLKRAVARVRRDDSGVESVFQAITMAANEFRKFRRVDRETGQPLRNIMFIVFTDEAGDDQHALEESIEITQRVGIPVFVVGVPAPFGQQETIVKWIDPDPNYDQTPGWGRVSQGPESVLPERIRIGNEADPKKEIPVDSGFGPYALTRLCYETGGIYFAVHPDRSRRRSASRKQVVPFSAHLHRFFDPEIMRRYRPDYVPLEDYQRLLRENSARTALVDAARRSWIAPMRLPQRHFVVQSEAQFASELTESQKAAAVLEPRLNELYAILQQGELDRDDEDVARWQAGYDLAIGRTLATLARTKTFNAMLAQAKRGLQPNDPKNNTWTIERSDQVEITTELKRASEKATKYLKRVVADHPGTPWAYLARKELGKPLGWKWTDSYTVTPDERRQAMQARNQRMPRDQQTRSIQRKPKRDVPRL